MSRAQNLVNRMLESEYDEHVKAHNLVQTWDKAYASSKELMGLKTKALDLFRELGRSVGYERQLAKVGLRKADVEEYIRGAQLGLTDNYKRSRPVKMCNDKWCSTAKRGRPLPLSTEKCPDCGNEVTDAEVPISLSHLRDKMADYIVGVVTKDGRRVWFDEPVAPRFSADPDEPVIMPRPRGQRLGNSPVAAAAGEPPMPSDDELKAKMAAKPPEWWKQR